jgi:hypothetical protein
MSAVAGVYCGGAPLHRTRTWFVNAERIVTWRDGDIVRRLETPLPGSAPLLLFDAFRQAAVLADGEGWRFDGGAAMWRPCASAVEDDVKATKNRPALIAGGSGCGALWFTTADRRVWSWTPTNGRAPLAEIAVPGDGAIVALDVAHRTVVLDDGTRYEWLADRWVRMPDVMSASSTIRVKCLSGTTLAGSGDFYPGQERDISEREARELIRRGVAEPVLP